MMKQNACRIIAVALTVLMLTGCAAQRTRNPLPEQYANTAQIPFIAEARFWGDTLPDAIQDRLAEIKSQMLEKDAGALEETMDYLAISGGGAGGAFGAGLLAGWSKTGKRPTFRMVTGVSTGALIAPFAFLGEDYDDELKELYTTTSTKDLVVWLPFLAMLSSDAAADTALMKAKLKTIVDVKMLQRIVIEYDKGRRLFIGTTNLDAQRSVIWNIGAIAKSGAPDALQLIRDIMLASASIPGAFPPVYIEVEADGKRYDEIHVDGGTASQVFLYPATLDVFQAMKRVGIGKHSRIYVIRNAQVDPIWKTVKPKLIPILGSTVDTLIRTQGIGDLYRIYLDAQHDDLDYYLAYIPAEFKETPKEVFDPEYMRKLYDLGYRMAETGYPWKHSPPGFTRLQPGGKK
jgi:predicted patatin/cPLA2 family phospholipase